MCRSLTNMKLIILLISFYFKWAIGQELKSHAFVDENSIYHIYWSVDGENITFEVQVATKGYVGFGFSPNGGMPGSDIVIGWVLPNGQVHFQDRHAIGFYEPLIDSEQNYNLLNAYENETHTVLRFTRKLNTCDKGNDTVITDSTMNVIYAWHPEDPQSVTNLHYHGTENRGAKNFLLLNPQVPFEITKDIVIWDVQMPNVTILPKITTIWCLGVKLPQFLEPHYYVGNTILITPGNENIVHHMVVNECRGDTTYYEDKYQQYKNGYDCSNSGELFEGIDCDPQIFVFSMGSQGLFYPEDVGRPLGEENGGASYFIFQTHYNNLEKKQGLVDSTTARLYLKKHVKNKAGTLTMAAPVDYTFIIPPKQPEFKISTYCPSECTSNVFPKEGITVFGAKVHSHLAGIRLSIRHFRSNKELEPIVVEDNYNFNYQLTRHLSETVKILQGDVLMGTCVYSSMDRNETTVGGMGSSDEMCSFSLYYYPVVGLTTCAIKANYNATMDYFGVEEVAKDKVHIVAPAVFQNQSMFDVIRHYDWTTTDDAKFKRMASLQYDAVKNVICINQSTMLMTVPIGYPTDIPPYIPPLDVCDITNDTIKTSTMDGSSY